MTADKIPGKNPEDPPIAQASITTTEDVSLSVEPESRTYNILAYAAEGVGISLPSQSIKTRNYTIYFETYETTRRFDEYDAVIVFQRTFEHYQYDTNYFSSHRYKHSCDRDELDKRQKELHLLLNKGGFACYIMHCNFADHYDSRDFSATDLCKLRLNYSSLYRKDASVRVAHVRPCRGELTRFCELYGAASTSFECHNDKLDLVPLVKVGSSLVGLALGGNEFFIPSLLPEDHRVNEYFQTLADAIIGIRNKFVTDVPAWADVFRFEREDEAIARLEELNQEALRLSEEIEGFRNFKRVLVADSDALVDAVSQVLRDGFNFSLDTRDEHREDIKILDCESRPILFAEIKGTNSGVKREYINQADSHRERAGLPSTFPTILIVNTHIKNARTIEEKDQPIPAEQVAHAKRIGVLILRTLDLLRLLRLVKRGAINPPAVLEMLTKCAGWLRCNDTAAEIISE